MQSGVRGRSANARGALSSQCRRPAGVVHFEVLLWTVVAGTFEVRATAADTRLGRRSFDIRVVNFRLQDFERKGGGKAMSGDRLAVGRLDAQRERAKRALSPSMQAAIGIVLICEGIDFSSVCLALVSGSSAWAISVDPWVLSGCVSAVAVPMSEACTRMYSSDAPLASRGRSRWPRSFAMVRYPASPAILILPAKHRSVVRLACRWHWVETSRRRAEGRTRCNPRSGREHR